MLIDVLSPLEAVSVDSVVAVPVLQAMQYLCLKQYFRSHSTCQAPLQRLMKWKIVCLKFSFSYLVSSFKGFVPYMNYYIA